VGTKDQYDAVVSKLKSGDDVVFEVMDPRHPKAASNTWEAPWSRRIQVPVCGRLATGTSRFPTIWRPNVRFITVMRDKGVVLNLIPAKIVCT